MTHFRDESSFDEIEPKYEKELHIWMGKPQTDNRVRTLTNLYETQMAINKGTNIIHTTQPHVCSTANLEKGYIIFAHMLDGETVELKLGHIDGCAKEIRREHNLERMLLAGCFGKARLVLDGIAER